VPNSVGPLLLLRSSSSPSSSAISHKQQYSNMNTYVVFMYICIQIYIIIQTIDQKDILKHQQKTYTYIKILIFEELSLVRKVYYVVHSRRALQNKQSTVLGPKTTTHKKIRYTLGYFLGPMHKFKDENTYKSNALCTQNFPHRTLTHHQLLVHPFEWVLRHFSHLRHALSHPDLPRQRLPLLLQRRCCSIVATTNIIRLLKKYNQPKTNQSIHSTFKIYILRPTNIQNQ
jgi:hypothetical protein